MKILTADSDSVTPKTWVLTQKALKLMHCGLNGVALVPVLVGIWVGYIGLDFFLLTMDSSGSIEV